MRRRTAPKPVTVERIERALDRVAELILGRASDGHRLLPLFDYLEKQLSEQQRKDDTWERIHWRASRKKRTTMTAKTANQPAVDYAPGSFGCHEALHMASVAVDLVDRALLEHPAIADVPEWKALADKAHQALFDLYQAIGEKHLSK